MTPGRVVRFDEHGDLAVLRLVDEAPRALDAGEVLLDVRAFGLNPSDAVLVGGNFFERPALPSRVGYDAAGVVAAIGPNVDTWAVGDRVFSLPAALQGPHGVHGSFAIVPDHALARLPASLDFEVGASLGVQYATAYFALAELCPLHAGEWVYVTAAAGNTGLAAIQVAHARGARVAAVARDPAERRTLESRGVDAVIDDADDSALALAMLEATEGRGVALIYDGIGGPRARLYGDLLARSGAVIVYGFLAGSELPIAGVPLYRKAARLSFYQVFHFTGTVGAAEHRASLDRLRGFFAAHLERGALAPEIAARYTLDEVREAYGHAQRGGVRGKIVVIIAP